MNRVIVALEHHFDRTPDNSIWTQTQFPYNFWRRYLDVFNEVRVVARVRNVPTKGEDWQRADGEGVKFAAVPDYLGPFQYLLRSREVQSVAKNVVKPQDFIILRLGSQIASCILPKLYRTGHPYGVEVVGDPFDVFSPGAVRHPLRPFFRYWSAYQLRYQCARACAVAYVTEYALQRRYPSRLNAFATYYSDVELTDSAIISIPRVFKYERNLFSLISVGMFGQLYKAPDVLIDAVALCISNGLNLKLVLVGDGTYRAELETRAARLGLGERVLFRGQLSTQGAVRAELDQADLFVLPSRTEGLPRAMIEAMARGLPCIGSTVGGIPELLPPEDLVPPGDVHALADKIRAIVTNPQRMEKMAAHNLAKSHQYRGEELKLRRINFYRYVYEQTKVWFEKQALQELPF